MYPRPLPQLPITRDTIRPQLCPPKPRHLPPHQTHPPRIVPNSPLNRNFLSKKSVLTKATDVGPVVTVGSFLPGYGAGISAFDFEDFVNWVAVSSCVVFVAVVAEDADGKVLEGKCKCWTDHVRAVDTCAVLVISQ